MKNLDKKQAKKVQLTPEGEILLRHIEPAMNLIQKGEAQLLDAASTGGQIRIGASDTICTSISNNTAFRSMDSYP